MLALLMIRIVGLSLLVLAAWRLAPALSPASPAALAQTAGEVTLDVRPGFDGVGKAGRWLPIRVTVANDGPGFDGDVQLITSTPGRGPGVAYGQIVELPSRSRKLVQLVVPAPASARDLKIEVVGGSGEVASRDVPVRLLGTSDFLVGVLADDDVPPAGLGSLRRGGGMVTVARVGIADLPTDPLALQALDALVVRNAASGRLSPEQRLALRAWIEAGGQLVVAGGPSWRRSTEGLDDLLPVEALWARQVKHLRAFQRYAGGPPADGNLLLTVGSAGPGARVFLEQDGIPLIVERWLGLGRVTFLAADPALEPFRSWAGAESVWQRVLVGGRPPLPGDASGTPSFEPQLRSALAQLMDLGLPGPGWLAAFLATYVVCAGPLQYVVLRRIDRREWAWVGFPALGLGFAALAYLGGGWLRGSDVRLGAISIVRSVPSSQTALADTYVGLVAPTRRSYDLQFVDGPTPRTLFGEGGLATDRATIRPGRPTRLPGLRLEGRTLQAFQHREVVSAPSPVQAELRATSGRLEGLIANAGPDRLEDAFLLAADEALPLGDIAPGASRPVSLAVPTSRFGNGPKFGALSIPGAVGALPQQTDSRRMIASSLAAGGGGGESSGGVLLMAWVGATPPRLSADGVPIDGTAIRLLEQALPVNYGDDALAIPPGLLGRTVLDGAALNRGPGPAFAVRGPIIFQYDLPPEVRFARVDRLSIHLSFGRAISAAGLPTGTTPTGVPVRVSLFRWADRTWVDVPLGTTTGVSDINFRAGFIDGGAVRLRVEPNTTEAYLQQLDLSLEGIRG